MGNGSFIVVVLAIFVRIFGCAGAETKAGNTSAS
jgi:hypothetical protein